MKPNEDYDETSDSSISNVDSTETKKNGHNEIRNQSNKNISTASITRKINDNGENRKEKGTESEIKNPDHKNISTSNKMNANNKNLSTANITEEINDNDEKSDDDSISNIDTIMENTNDSEVMNPDTSNKTKEIDKTIVTNVDHTKTTYDDNSEVVNNHNGNMSTASVTDERDDTDSLISIMIRETLEETEPTMSTTETETSKESKISISDIKEKITVRKSLIPKSRKRNKNTFECEYCGKGNILYKIYIDISCECFFALRHIF